MESRRPAVAGSFYPAQPAKLRETIAGYLRTALDAMPAEEKDPKAPLPKALIAPHAGYVYSGPVAASAYARIVNARGIVTRVVLAGPAHRVAVRALAATGLDGFETPLGTVPIDKDAIALIGKLPQVQINDLAHAAEHSLEVHVPFLQFVLGPDQSHARQQAEKSPDAGFKLVPLAVGDAVPEETAAVFDALWGGPETLFVISTDLSHFHAYETARLMDANAAKAIEALDPNGLAYEQACGRAPVAGMLLTARKRGLRVKTLDLRSSGDTASSRDTVVGYGAWALYEA